VLLAVGQSGERKYHVQFFKFNSASPVSVRTRVRHLPHAITPGSSSSSNSSSNSNSSGCGVGRTRCFLEVNVQNSTQLVMQLHAVRLLAASGVAAQQIAPLSGPEQQQQQRASIQAQQQLQPYSHGHQQDQQQQQQQVNSKGVDQAQLAPSGATSMGSSDIAMQQDIDLFAASTSFAAAPSVQHKQHQLLSSDQPQQQQQHLHLPAQGPFSSLQGPDQQQVVPLPAGCSHNSLWRIDHQLAGAAAGSTSSTSRNSSSSSSATGGPPAPQAVAAGAAGPSGPYSTGNTAAGSSSSSTLGRLELHWSTCDGRTGRLLTQPLTGPVPASGKEVLMQLHQVLPGSPAVDAATAAGYSVLSPQQLTTRLTVNQPFTATLTLTAGLHDMGPLLVLYTTTVPSAPGASSSGSTSGLASSSTQLATDSSSIQFRRFGGVTSDTSGDGSCPEVVVQGSRSRRVAALAAGQSVDVPFELLPLRCGWLRLPTFVVAAEADGRLLDGVHDVHVLVVN
jgi:hypothetical protein